MMSAQQDNARKNTRCVWTTASPFSRAVLPIWTATWFTYRT